MAKKPIAGKKWFEALGRSERSRGVPRSARSAATLKRQTWPDWAVTAYMRGWINQSMNYAKGKTVSAEITGGNDIDIELVSFRDAQQPNGEVQRDARQGGSAGT
jgi:hypothetical protein